MLASMTAYGRAKKNYTDIEITVDIQSVNKKHLDCHIKLPPEAACFEPYIRKVIADRIGRGNLTVTVQVVFLSSYPVKVHLNSAYAKILKDSALVLAQELGCADAPITDLLPIIFKERGVLQVSPEEVDNQAFQDKLGEVLLLACEELIALKQREGQALLKEFLLRLEKLEKYGRQIRELSHNATDKYRKRLTELLSQFTQDPQGTDERIEKEIAIIADKVDISEELARLDFHLQNFRDTLLKGGSVGKVLEFMLQEIQREINTIGSKGQDAQVAALVIAAKAEIEKIREQVQNVE